MKRLFLLLCIILYIQLSFAHTTLRHLSVMDGLPNNQVRQIVELPNGQMLVETEGMFSLFNGRNFVPLTCNLDSVLPLPTFGCHSHLWQGDSLLWLKDYYSLYLFDVRMRKFIYDYDKYKVSLSLQRFINEDGDSVTHARLRALECLHPLLDTLVNGTSLQYEQLQAYQCDHQGGQWFGMLNSGIIYSPPQPQKVRLLPSPNGDFIRRMIDLDSRTMLMAGEHGIYMFDCETKHITRTLATGSIHCAEMSRDQQGRIWMATKQGIYCYDNGRLVVYDHTNTIGFKHDHNRFVLPIDESRLLVCNFMHHLGFFYPNERRMEILNERLPALSEYRTMITAKQLPNRNKAAICTQNGCFVLDLTRLQMEPLSDIQSVSSYSHKYNCMLLDRNGNLWMGTQNGLLILDEDKTRRLTRNEGLSNECIQSIAEDPTGNIWVGTSHGVNRIRVNNLTGELHIRNIGADDGLPNVEMTERGICLMSDGTLYLATPVGLVYFSTNAFQIDSVAPSVVLVGLSVAGEDMPLDSLPLHLSYRQNYIDLQVSALNYAHPASTRYRYRVIGMAGGWNTALNEDGRLASIRLEGLSPGSYTIEIQASTGDNIWGDVFCKTFFIMPPFWLTWWAKLLYVLFFSFTILGLLRWYIYNHQKKLQRENEQRINELFELREEARHQFAQSVEIRPERLAVNSEEHQIIERIMKVIGENMANTEYTVDALARDIGMSRAHLYRKMQTMLGITPNDFMRNVRLKHAAKLLTKSDLPVNQLSLMVGFQTPRYFSQCFRKMFGVTPTEYREGRSTSPKNVHI